MRYSVAVKNLMQSLAPKTLNIVGGRLEPFSDSMVGGRSKLDMRRLPDIFATAIEVVRDVCLAQDCFD